MVLKIASMLLSGLVLIACGIARGQDPASTAGSDALLAVREYHATHARKILDELRDFLALPNVASDRDQIERNADHLVALLERRGIAARTLRVPGAPPAVYGAYNVPDAARTVVFYAHYDGQPAPADQGWVSDPWTPVLRAGALADGADVLDWTELDGDIDEDWRIYARSASDDKSPIIALLAAFDALQAAGIEPAVNLRFFFEGEEEAGSPHLADLLHAHRDLLTADLWLFCDGPVHQDGRGQVVFGVRGALGLEMTVYGPLRALHSGHYGNWAPNPAARLAELIASMRNGDGDILVDGFYDQVRPLGDAEQAALAAVPDADTALRRELAIGRAEADDARLVERIMLPAINVRGIRAGGVQDEAANAIPTEAHASMDFRLVPDLGPDDVKSLVEAHVRAQGYTIVRDTPAPDIRRKHAQLVRMNWGGGYPGLRTPMDLPVSRAVAAAVEAARGEAVVRIPNLGGSLPIYLFDEILDTTLIIVPMVNHDNNQHAANENVRIGNIWTGIDMYAYLMARLDW
ncbi:MAG TPA: M20/M25/M40 family metallo-hydrolase [Gammaproteobacteria bacterium]|nr:M20/M25/M40 family metallo-hydrolase [Gammaproteobacteria bacterium]